MSNRVFAACLLTGFFVCSLAPLFAAPEDLSVELLATFDYPGAGNSTTPYHISSRGDVTGIYVDPSGATRGFTRSKTGVFSAPLADPNDDSQMTVAGGINNLRTVAGYYFNSAQNSHHGFFLTSGTYSTYDAPFADETFLLDLNDLGDFSGYFFIEGEQVPFAQVAGVFTQFNFSPSGPIKANGLNGRKQVVGEYVDFFSPPIYHGFYYDIDKFVIARPFDYPGATSTSFMAVNDRNIIVGHYLDTEGAEHGLVFKLPATYVSYDYPGATGTSLNGINNSEFASGSYTDGSGVNHGFIARIHFVPN